MSNFALNIKFLRNKNGWSQAVLGEKTDVARSTIADYERRKSEPSFSQLIKIAEILEVTIDDLLKKNLKEQQYEIIRNKHFKVLAISVDKNDDENIEFVSQKAQAGYTAGYSDPEFIANLPKVQVPRLEKGTFRAFEITGNSMLPIEPDSLILTSYIEDFDSLKDFNPYIVVTENDGIVFKKLKNKGTKVLAISENLDYAPYLINKSEIMEIWKFEAFVSFEYPTVSTLQNIEKKIDLLLDVSK